MNMSIVREPLCGCYYKIFFLENEGAKNYAGRRSHRITKKKKLRFNQKKVSEGGGWVNITHKVYLQPILSALWHCPTGVSAEQEKFPMKPQAITEAMSCPKAHHTESSVNVHYSVTTA